jgi:hypothetical protein
MLPLKRGDPKVPDIVVYQKRDAARTQLETAITLWFHYGDPISIHTLAAAAHGCYRGMAATIKQPTVIETWKKSLSKNDRKLANKTQNFAKHANTDPDGIDQLLTAHAELLILDSIVTHERLFRSRTPLMTCFFARLTFENPRLTECINLARLKKGIQDLVGDEFVEWNRVEFFNRELPALIAAISAD